MIPAYNRMDALLSVRDGNPLQAKTLNAGCLGVNAALVILNHGQVKRTTSKLAPPSRTFSVRWPPQHGGSSKTLRFELMTLQLRAREPNQRILRT
ncbi:hypothetical protein TNCV_2305071 [Trichonephila clavipes]|nr:hypothetical protein TNCV_2305071 [Trichonephila clavipes]